MSRISASGMLEDLRVIQRRLASIEHGALAQPRAIVLHQTDSPSEESTLHSYATQATGAHFLIGKGGQIHQTASMHRQCYHVGRLIKSKCLALSLAGCRTPTLAKALALTGVSQFRAIDNVERQKSYPDRYPVNSDSLGIEMVGRHVDDRHYEPLTAEQEVSLQWLVGELFVHFTLTGTDVYRHPEVSYKHPGEAQSATWPR